MYDDQNMAQWVSGQLTNVYNIQDPTLLKQLLLQVIMATRDATTLPWQAVKSAWATSMHEIEEGSLQWFNTTQWSLNRISTSQLAMTNFQGNSQTKKTLSTITRTSALTRAAMVTICMFAYTAVGKVGSQLTQKASVHSNSGATVDPRGTIVRTGGRHQDSNIKRQ